MARGVRRDKQKKRAARAAARAKKFNRRASQQGNWTKGALQVQAAKRKADYAVVAAAVAFAQKH
eukprot:2732370-Pleurochrysis_carterae.AAC.1